MADELFISIIINNYNYDRFLKQAIDSALNQAYPLIEVVVVDDCSTDSSREIIAQYGESIKPVLHKKNGKQGAAFNSGFLESSGDIIIFLDADDYLYPNAVERIVECWNPNLSKIHYRLDVVDAIGNKRGYTLPPATLPLATGDVAAEVTQRGTYNGVSTSGNAISRAALSNVMPIPSEYSTTSDDYLSVLIPLFGEVAAINEPLGAYRLHDSNQWAMTELDSKRFHRFIRHDLQRCDLIKDWGQRLGYTVPENLYMRSFGRVWSRLSSFRLDPVSHPVISDTAPQLTFLGLRALWQYSQFSGLKRLVFSLWFLWVGLLPTRLAKPAIVWLFAPHLRPKGIDQALKTLRTWITIRPRTTDSNLAAQAQQNTGGTLL